MPHPFAVLLDKDGTLLDDVPYNVEPSRMRFAPGARRALRLFAKHDVALYVVSNQSGVALGRFAPAALAGVEARLHEMTGALGARLAGFYWCPHHPAGSVAPFARVCACRKPAPGLLLRAAREHGFALEKSCFIGDILDDVEAGRRAGCRTILLDNGHETEWRTGPLRRPDAMAADLYQAARIALGWLGLTDGDDVDDADSDGTANAAANDAGDANDVDAPDAYVAQALRAQPERPA